MLPNDNVSMPVGLLDHVLIVYSSMEHVTWKSMVGMVVVPYVKGLSEAFARILKSHGIASPNATELCGSSEGQGQG